MQAENRAYENPRVVRWYRTIAARGLTPPEASCLGLVEEGYRGSVLDIGIGAGRTTAPLLEMFEDYVGIDYSAPMVSAARKAFPDLNLHVMDARDIQLGRQFDCAVFSYNGICTVGYQDRMRVLDSVAHHLRPGGYFIYSSKNLQYNRTKAWLESFFVKEMFQNWKWALRSGPNRLRFFWKQKRGDGYAWLNDPSEGFRLMMTYTSMENEIGSLERSGFKVLASIGQHRDSPGYDDRDEWIYIVARKVADGDVSSDTTSAG